MIELQERLKELSTRFDNRDLFSIKMSEYFKWQRELVKVQYKLLKMQNEVNGNGGSKGE